MISPYKVYNNNNETELSESSDTTPNSLSDDLKIEIDKIMLQ